MAMARRAPAGVVGDLLDDAGPADDMDGDDEQFSVDAERKAAFQEMCQAIRDGDDEAAWAAFQELGELE